MSASDNVESLKEGENKAKAKDVYHAVDNVADQLSTIETFIARRFDELSMEINATSQQVDMAEEGIARRFGEILEILHAVSFSGDGNTPANAGVELDAVVEMTEKAANRILDAADRIATKISSSLNEEQRKAAQIDEDIEEIFMACSFQDITGQRIRNTLENLKAIEDRLGTALDKMGIVVQPDTNVETAQIVEAQSQDDIDELFS
ncbi:MAG: protein phosphatase CheZ [Alphaproteobacteria bacterium]